VRLDLYLHPKQSNTVLREKLYAALRQKLAYAKALTTRVREDWQDLRAFYEQKGFIEVERQWESRLDVTVFDPQPFRSVLDKAQAAGIVFKTLADVMTETLEPVKAIQCLMYQTITQDLLPSVPFAEPLEIWDFDTWLERYWHAPERCFESVFMAFAKDEFVGMSELYQAEDVTKLKNGLTAVKEKHRRKGIATSLKLKAALYAKSKGIKEIVTTNHSINRPMLAINEAMGFVKDPAWIRLKKEINS
jgi:GNAT superfamily N-acetyltransferase